MRSVKKEVRQNIIRKTQLPKLFNKHNVIDNTKCLTEINYHFGPLNRTNY